MDPISVISGVTSIGLAALRVSKLLHDIYGSFCDAPSTIKFLISECYSINGALSQLQGWLCSEEPHAKSNHRFIQLDILLNTISATMSAFSELEEEVQRVSNSNSKFLPLNYMWKERDMANSLQQLQSHKASLNLMLSILSSQSDARIQETLDKITAFMSSMSKDQQRMWHKIKRSNLVSADGRSLHSKSSESIRLFEDTSSITRRNGRYSVIVEGPPPSFSYAFEHELKCSTPYRRQFEDDDDGDDSESILTLDNVTDILNLSLPRDTSETSTLIGNDYIIEKRTEYSSGRSTPTGHDYLAAKKLEEVSAKTSTLFGRTPDKQRRSSSEASTQTDSPIQSEVSIQTESLMGSEASVQTDSLIGSEASVQTDGFIGSEAGVQTENPVELEASVENSAPARYSDTSTGAYEDLPEISKLIEFDGTPSEQSKIPLEASLLIELDDISETSTIVGRDDSPTIESGHSKLPLIPALKKNPKEAGNQIPAPKTLGVGYNSTISWSATGSPNIHIWARFWNLQTQDLEKFPAPERARQEAIHRNIRAEIDYHRTLHDFITTYKSPRYFCLLEATGTAQGLDRSGIALCREGLKNLFDIFDKMMILHQDLLASLFKHANKEGPWIQDIYEAYEEWLQKAKTIYTEFPARYYDIQSRINRVRQQYLVTNYLERCFEDEQGPQSDWQTIIKAPITRVFEIDLSLRPLILPMKHTHPTDILFRLTEFVKDVKHKFDTETDHLQEVNDFKARLEVNRDFTQWVPGLKNMQENSMILCSGDFTIIQNVYNGKKARVHLVILDCYILLTDTFHCGVENSLERSPLKYRGDAKTRYILARKPLDLFMVSRVVEFSEDSVVLPRLSSSKRSRGSRMRIGGCSFDYPFAIVEGERVYYFGAPDATTREHWISTLCALARCERIQESWESFVPPRPMAELDVWTG